jgi:hypothetical protein
LGCSGRSQNIENCFAGGKPQGDPYIVGVQFTGTGNRGICVKAAADLYFLGQEPPELFFDKGLAFFKDQNLFRPGAEFCD